MLRGKDLVTHEPSDGALPLDNREVVRLDEAYTAQEAVRSERLLEGAAALGDQAADLRAALLLRVLAWVLLHRQLPPGLAVNGKNAPAPPGEPVRRCDHELAL